MKQRAITAPSGRVILRVPNACPKTHSRSDAPTRSSEVHRRYVAHCQRSYRGRRAYDEEDVEERRAYHVAYGYVGILFYGGDYRGGQFGKRRSGGNYGQSYDRFAHSKRFGYVGRSIDEPTPSENQSGKPSDDGQGGKPRLHFLHVCLPAGTLCGLRAIENV